MVKVLNMIVKNESRVIERCLDSFKKVVGAIVISDTGSNDDTIEKMEKWRVDNGKQGLIVSHEWKNFQHNRNLALLSCLTWLNTSEYKDDDNYIVFIDADDYIVIEDEKKFLDQMNNLTHDKYLINMKCGNLDYGRMFTVKAPKQGNKVIPLWYSVLHEYLTYPGTEGKILNCHIQASREGARSADPMKYLKDAVVLEEALKTEPDNPRYVFYLAQSYRDYGGELFLKMAEKLYIRRANMEESWIEERVLSFVEAAKCRINRGKNDNKTCELLVKAFNMRPTRLEAAYYLVRYYRLNGNHIMGYTFGKSLLDLPYPTDVLFVNVDIHRWMFKDELAITASWFGDKPLYRKLCKEILACPEISESNRKRIERDLKIYG